MDQILIRLLSNKAANKREGKESEYAKSLHELAYYYKTKEEYCKSIDEFEELASLYLKLNDRLNYAKIHRYISELYLELGNFKESTSNILVYFGIVSNLNDNGEIQRALATMSRIYLTEAISILQTSSSNGKIKRASALLDKAKQYAERSLIKCDELTNFKRFDKMDMKARVLQNLSVIHENMSDLQPKNSEESTELFAKAIKYALNAVNICKIEDNFKLLYKSHFTVSELYKKKCDYVSALYHLDEAISLTGILKHGLSDVASNHELYILKAELYLKMNDYHNSKLSFSKAYTLFSGSINEQDKLLNQLKLVSLISQNEDYLLETSMNNFIKRKTIYETMGDACCELEAFEKAIDFYKAMLDCCIKYKGNMKEMAACYVSLAVTYRDLKNYEESLDFFRKELHLYSDIKTHWKAIAETLKNISELKYLLDPTKKLDDIFIDEVNSLTIENDEIRSTILNQIHHNEKNNDDNTKISTLNLDEVDISSEKCTQDINDIDDINRRKRRKEMFRVRKNAKGESELHTACIEGNFSLVKQLVYRGHPVNVRDFVGWLPIHEASNFGHYNIVKFLLQNGASVNDDGGKNTCGVTPLLDAAINGHLEVCQLLIEHGASLIATTHKGETVLDHLRMAMEVYKFNDKDLELYKKLENMTSIALEKTIKLKDTKTKVSEVNIGHLRRSLDTETSTSSSSFVKESNKITNNYADAINLLRHRSFQRELTPLQSLLDEKQEEMEIQMEINDLDIDMSDWLEDDLYVENKNKNKNKNNTKRNQKKNLSSQESNNEEISNNNFNEIIAINVKINDKILRIPIQKNQSHKLTLEYLAEDAARRYCELEGVRPILQLRTLDNAILSHSDTIDTILSLNTIDSTILSSHTVSLYERFQGLCKIHKIEPDKEMCKIIEQCQVKHILSIANKFLKSNALVPLFKSMFHMKFISTIDLSGNSLKSENFQLLCQAISTFDTLNHLNLSTTGIKFVDLSHFANCFISYSNYLNKLSTLNLSFNTLENISSQYIAKILKYAKCLCKLNLTGCEFIDDIFDKDSIKWDLKTIEILFLGMNNLNEKSIETLLKNINVNIFKQLNLFMNHNQDINSTISEFKKTATFIIEESCDFS